MYNHATKDDPCFICPAIQGVENDEILIKQTDIFYKDSFITAFISSFFRPNNPGHVIIVPNEHYENIYDLPDEISHKIQDLAKQVAIALKAVYQSDGVSTAQHNEPAGNQHAFHYHFHVFPRYKDDQLYELMGEKIVSTPEQRLPYAEKLKTYFKSL